MVPLVPFLISNEDFVVETGILSYLCCSKLNS